MSKQFPKVFNVIPHNKPAASLLDQIDYPHQLRQLDEVELLQLADELREYLLYIVGQTGGHFGAGLGVIELTIALHYVFHTPDDRLVWDVGHQAYPHKILTGRKHFMHTLRQAEGLSAFPNRDESQYDAFGVGHSSTSISAALGMALAAKQQGIQRKAVAVIGDGALTAGMAYEALNHATGANADLLVVLNDNDMSISRNVGGMSNYLARLLSSRAYTSMREGGKKALSHLPRAMDLARRTEEHMKGMVVPGTLFEELGFNYIGPIDGHNLPVLIKTLRNMQKLNGPQFLHVVTQKGKGFTPAEDDPIGYHALTKIEPNPPVKSVLFNEKKKIKYSKIFGQWLCDMARVDERLMGITPAMKEGSDLVKFAEQYPDRYFDVAIAEQHAVTLAAGMACDGSKPVVAIYSTFLQRAYDQLIHDVALQNLDVLFAIDRAGLVGEDGPTHAGSFDLSYLRCVPNIIVMAPSDENETRQMLYTGYIYKGPAAVRYPRGTGMGSTIQEAMTLLPIGKANIKSEGKHVAILAFGSMVQPALEAGDMLNATVIDMRFVKPLDEEVILKLAGSHELLVTVEENTISGGAGSGVNEFLAAHNIQIPMLNLGLPDHFIDHGRPHDMLAQFGLDANGILASIQKRMTGSRLNSESIAQVFSI